MADAAPSVVTGGMSPVQQALATLADAQKYELARILTQFVDPNQDCQVITLALDVAKTSAAPFEIGSFTSLYVQDATDSNVLVNCRINSKDLSSGSFKLQRKDVLGQEYPIARAYLDWAAQAGKSVTLILFRHANFKPGSTLTQVSGGTTLSDGASYARAIVSPVAGAAAVALFPADSTAIKRTSINDAGFDLYVGESALIDDGSGSAGVNKGLLWPNGTPQPSQNTAALFVYNPAGNPTPNLVVMTEK